MEEINKAYATFQERDRIASLGGGVEKIEKQHEKDVYKRQLFLGINKKNPPQIAIWTEDMKGHYLSTVYVTHKIATQSWQFSGGNRRKEALPHWCYQRGVESVSYTHLDVYKRQEQSVRNRSRRAVDRDLYSGRIRRI